MLSPTIRQALPGFQNSGAEIDRVITHLAPPHDLVVKVLYGCGLRLFECLGLRVQAINLDAEVITVHDGKGGKDRTVPLPKTLKPLIKSPNSS